MARRGTDARSIASLPRPAASDAGALAWESRPCIPVDKQILMGRIFGLRKVVVNISNMLV